MSTTKAPAPVPAPKAMWRKPSGIWRIRSGVARLTHARTWNRPVIEFFFRVVVAGARRQKSRFIGPIYKRVMLFTPAARKHTYGVLLPLNVDLASEADSAPLPIDLIKECLRSASYIASMQTCVCRDSFKCTSHPHELCCLFLSKSGRRVVDHGIAYEMPLEDALRRVDEAATQGLVGQALWVEVEQFIWGLSNDDMDGFMEICFCCPCCCVGMAVCKNATRDVKGHFHSSGYTALVDTSTCIACGDCVPVCIGEAITLGDAAISIDQSSCVGCGLCIAPCPTSAIRIEQTGPVFPSLREQFREQGRLDIVL